MTENLKIAMLLGNQNEGKEKKIVENLLGRSTYIMKPHSLTETQYLDLQKSKKFTSEVISPDKHTKNSRRNQFDPHKNQSLLKSSCHKVSQKNSK